LALASQLAAGRSTTPSFSIMGSNGVKAKRSMPTATASETSPASAMAHGPGDTNKRSRCVSLAIKCSTHFY